MSSMKKRFKIAAPFQAAMILKPRDVEAHDAERALHHVGERAVDLRDRALGVVDPTEHLERDVQQQALHFVVEHDAVLRRPTLNGPLDDGLNLRGVRAHRRGLEGALHDAPVDAVLVVVAHDEATLKEVSHDRLPTHLGREVLLAIHHDPLDVVRVQEQDALVAGDRNAADRAVLLVVAIEQRLRVTKHVQGLADERPAILAAHVAQVPIGRPLIVGKLARFGSCAKYTLCKLGLPVL